MLGKYFAHSARNLHDFVVRARVKIFTEQKINIYTNPPISFFYVRSPFLKSPLAALWAENQLVFLF
jgi:hypothetical protein